MTKYYIQNSKGERKNLSLGNSVFVKQANGIGVSFDNSFGKIENGFQMIVKGDVQMDEVVLELMYMDNAFTEYAELSHFLLSDSKMTLVYAPDGETEYKKEVTVSYIEKSRRDSNGVMIAALSLSSLSPWYRTQELSGTSVTFTAIGDMPSAFVITGTNSGTSSSRSITASDGVNTKQVCTLIRDWVTGDTFEYSSVPNDAHTFVNGEDAINYASIDTMSYLSVPSGKSITLSWNGTINVEAYHYWRTV